MNQFTLQQGSSRELELSPHIKEFALRKNNTIQLDSFIPVLSETLRCYYIVDGKFEWVINGQHLVLYPGDMALALPGHEIGGSKGYLDIGTLFWLHIEVEKIENNSGTMLGTWSKLSEMERLTIRKILLLNNMWY